MNAEEIHERLARPLEPMTDEEIELVVEQLIIEFGKISRMCNHLLNRPRGLSIHALSALDHIKSDISWLKWHCEKHRLRGDDGATETL